MKIIAGEARGREILLPEGQTTRPILSLLKTRLFDILSSRLPGAVAWDLFAGSGTLGLEAISRGARRVLFCEKDRAAFKLLESNIDRLGFVARARAYFGDGRTIVPHAEETPVDVVFLDPPFPMSDGQDDAWFAMIESLAANHLDDEGLVVLRTRSSFTWRRPLVGLREIDRRDHGENSLLFIAR